MLSRLSGSGNTRRRRLLACANLAQTEMSVPPPPRRAGRARRLYPARLFSTIRAILMAAAYACCRNGLAPPLLSPTPWTVGRQARSGIGRRAFLYSDCDELHHERLFHEN